MNWQSPRWFYEMNLIYIYTHISFYQKWISSIQKAKLVHLIAHVGEPEVLLNHKHVIARSLFAVMEMKIEPVINH
jgi:hypothetical protein